MAETTPLGTSGPIKPILSDEEKYKRAAQRAAIGAATARFLMWTTLLVGAVLFMLPLYIMMVMALKTPAEVSGSSVWALPKVAQWSNFNIVLTNPNAPFFAFAKNTITIATLSTLGVILSSSLVAYGFARVNFRGRDRLFILLLSTMMLPAAVTRVPTFVLYTKLGWVDTFYPFIVPAFLGSAWNIFLLRQFFRSIPRDLDEAAILDGANHRTIFWRVIMPNSGAALATVGILSFIYTWKDFEGPLVFLNSPEKQTLELGLNTYRSLRSEQWELLMAGSVLVMIPLLVMFIAGQRYFVKGIVMSGIK